MIAATGWIRYFTAAITGVTWALLFSNTVQAASAVAQASATLVSPVNTRYDATAQMILSSSTGVLAIRIPGSGTLSLSDDVIDIPLVAIEDGLVERFMLSPLDPLAFNSIAMRLAKAGATLIAVPGLSGIAVEVRIPPRWGAITHEPVCILVAYD